MKETMASLCTGCDKPFEGPATEHMEIGVLKQSDAGDESTTSGYCGACAKKIGAIDMWVLCDDLDLVLRGKLGSPISISEERVREIASNLGATKKVEEALIERIFGANWNGPPPEDSGLVMNRYANRDRLVAFVAMKLRDLWNFEA